MNCYSFSNQRAKSFLMQKGLNFFSKAIIMPVVWLAICLSLFFFFAIDIVVWMLTFWWDRQQRFLHRYSTIWALFYLWINPFWRIRVKGTEHIRKGQAYIIISNHQSAMDIVLLYRLWMHFKWVAKREIFRIPFIGWNLWLCKHIAIDRASVRGARTMIVQAQTCLSKGCSVLIFPEGTRSPDGRIKRFKEGAFVLAKKTGVPILPVILNGTREVFPKNGYTLKGSQTFTIEILPEIQPASFLNKDVETLTNEVNQLFSDKHSEIAPKYYETNP